MAGYPTLASTNRSGRVLFLIRNKTAMNATSPEGIRQYLILKEPKPIARDIANTFTAAVKEIVKTARYGLPAAAGLPNLKR